MEYLTIHDIPHRYSSLIPSTMTGRESGEPKRDSSLSSIATVSSPPCLNYQYSPKSSHPSCLEPPTTEGPAAQVSFPPPPPPTLRAPSQEQRDLHRKNDRIHQGNGNPLRHSPPYQNGERRNSMQLPSFSTVSSPAFIQTVTISLLMGEFAVAASGRALTTEHTSSNAGFHGKLAHRPLNAETVIRRPTMDRRS